MTTTWEQVDAIKHAGDALSSELAAMGWEPVELPGLYAARKRGGRFRVVARSREELLRKVREYAERVAMGRAEP